MNLHLYLIPTESGEYGDFLPADFSHVPSTVIDLNEDDPLAAAPVELNLALSDRVWAAHWYFVYPPDAQGRVTQADPPIAFVDSLGQIIWPGWQYENVTLGDFHRSAEFEFFDGDVGAIVLDPRPYGDGAPLEWSEFLGWLTTLATGVSAYVGTKEVAQDVRNAAAGLGRVLRHAYRWLIGRGGRDPRFLLTTVLSKEAWRVGTLARLLRLDEDNARILLEALGYFPVAGDLYRRQSVSPGLRDLLIEEHLAGDPIDFRWRHRDGRSSER